MGVLIFWGMLFVRERERGDDDGVTAAHKWREQKDPTSTRHTCFTLAHRSLENERHDDD